MYFPRLRQTLHDAHISHLGHTALCLLCKSDQDTYIQYRISQYSPFLPLSSAIDLVKGGFFCGKYWRLHFLAAGKAPSLPGITTQHHHHPHHHHYHHQYHHDLCYHPPPIRYIATTVQAQTPTQKLTASEFTSELYIRIQHIETSQLYLEQEVLACTSSLNTRICTAFIFHTLLLSLLCKYYIRNSGVALKQI